MKRKIPLPSEHACSGCRQANDLIEWVAQANNGPASTPKALVKVLPSILESALGHLMADFDYEAEIDSHRAVAARLVAICTDQLIRARPPATLRDKVLHSVHRKPAKKK